MGKLSILSIVLLCLALAVAQETTLTYIIEHQIDQSDQYVEMELSVSTQGKSLQNAIADAARVIAAIKRISQRYCLEAGQSKAECEEVVDVSQYEVEPKYHLVRKVETFTLFILTQEVSISIHNIKTLGKMIDQIIQAGQGLVTLNNFAWKADDELDSEKQTLRQGLKEGQELCGRLGKSLTQVLSVEELSVPKQQQGEEEERDEDLAEEEVELTIFKFKVKCGPMQKKKKGK